jgi:beta-lactamase superfamily II metal-dependent hydrolase
MKPHLYILLFLLLLEPDLFSQRLTIHHIDVGQGDATLIRTSNGKSILVDAGDAGKGETVILPYLRHLGITSIDYLIASHYHSDHIGAIDEIVQRLSPDSIRTVLDRGSMPPLPTTRAFRQYWSAAQSTSRHNTVYLGQSIKLTDELSLQCLAVDGAVLGRGEIKGSKGDENNRSIAWLLSSEHTEGGKNFSFRYFTGGDCGGLSDAYADLETPLAAIVGDVDAMKINHHGSRYSTNRTFLDSLRPEAVVISVGDHNVYHHPAQETLDRLQNTPSIRHIYQTEHGSGATTVKAIVAGTVTISVFDSFYTVCSDTFRLNHHPVLNAQPVSVVDGHSDASVQNRIQATVENGILTLSVQEATLVSIRILNLLGQEIRNLQEKVFSPGTHQIDLFGPALPSGVYFVRISTSSGILVRKAPLVH